MSRPLALASLAWLLAIALAAVAGVLAVMDVHRRASDALETIAPRYARLLGVQAGRERIATAASQLGQGAQRHAYDVARDASQTANDAQQRAKDLFSKAGLEVLTMQVQPVRQTPHYERVPIALRIEGELQALQAALATLPSTSPTIFVEGFVVQSSASAEGAATRVVCELQLFVLRAKS